MKTWQKKIMAGTFSLVFVGAALLLGAMSSSTHVSAAACVPPTTNYGSATHPVSVSATTSYVIWSRIKVPDTTHNSYLLEVDGNTCFTVGKSANIPANTWTWVNYQNGSTASLVSASLTTGNHTLKLIGSAANVQLDRVVLTADTSCVPTGTGDNCASPPDTTAPTVSLTSPLNSASVSGTVSLGATASDDTGGSGIAKVEFYVDDQLKGSDTTSPYAYSLDTSTLANGNHAVTAKAFDIAGNSKLSSPVTINVSNGDTTPPSVSITGVTQGATVTGASSVIAATASDNKGVTKVDFVLDGVLTRTELNPPYCLLGDDPNGCFTWDSTTVANGSHSIKATAYDAAGNSKSSTTVTFTVQNPDTTAPTVALSSPANGSTHSGSVTLTAQASDNVGGGGVSKVEFYVDGQLKSTDTTSPTPFTYVLDTKTLPDTTHTLTAQAFDVAGNKTMSSAVTITTANGDTTPPTVSLTGISDGSAVAGLVTVAATAADNKGVTKVEFYTDGVLTRTELNPPYCLLGDDPNGCFTWDSATLPNGPHSITAKSYDAAGNLATDTVAFTVQNGDTTPPSVPTNIAAVANSATQVTVTWTASTDNKGVTGYCITRNGVSLGCPASTTTTFIDGKLQPSTTYSYKVTAKDAAGNFSAASAAASVTTPAAPDTTPPSAPANFTATAVSTSQINLSWVASTDNVGVTSYDIYRVGTTSKIQTVTTTSAGITGLTASTAYSFYVIARDAANNTSVASNIASATTWTPVVVPGALAGVVSYSKFPLLGATVEMAWNGILHSYSTNSVGEYTFTSVPAGNYWATYSYQYTYFGKKWFLEPQTHNVTIVAGKTTTKNVTLTR